MSHTPEPWDIYRDGDRVYLVRAGSVEIRSPSLTKADWIAEFDPDATGHHPDEDEANALRCMTAVNACRGLGDEQVAAISRLVAWFVSPLPDDADEAVAEFSFLESVFPPKQS